MDSTKSMTDGSRSSGDTNGEQSEAVPTMDDPVVEMDDLLLRDEGVERES